MDASETMSTRVRKSELLYPLMVIAAIAMTVFSVVGVATMMGWMPGALSGSEPAAKAKLGAGDPRSPASVPRTASGDRSAVANARAICSDCGVIESVRPVEVPGDTSRMGAAGAGAVAGGLPATRSATDTGALRPPP